MPLGIITLEDVLEGTIINHWYPVLELNLVFNLELIGEEIYDEFDQQGARGDPYEVPPVQEEKHHDPAPPGTEVSAPKASPPPVHMPTALRGFNFLRSRSAPPVPREEGNPLVEAHSPGPIPHKPHSSSGIARTQSSSNVEVPRFSEDSIIQAPTIVVQRDALPDITPLSETTPLSLPTGVGTDVKSTPLPLSAVSSSSRTILPTPPLEAVLLERKRHLIGTASLSGSSSAVVSTVSPGTSTVPAAQGTVTARSAHAKGSRFKSSPLGAGKSASIVAVENVVEGDRTNEVEEKEVKGGDEEGRISREKDKDRISDIGIW
jgi:metal transporter CNNM